MHSAPDDGVALPVKRASYYWRCATSTETSLMARFRFLWVAWIAACQPADQQTHRVPVEAVPRLFTTRAVRLRAKPTLASPVVTIVPPADSVQPIRCDNSWCEVAFGRVNGFVQERYLADTPESAPPIRTARAPGSPTPERFMRSSAAREDAPPDGATARCRDGSYSRSTSRSGTCSHHGGVADWL